jgi:hypothetical protein
MCLLVYNQRESNVGYSEAVTLDLGQYGQRGK